jgi:hypothetical protein
MGQKMRLMLAVLPALLGGEVQAGTNTYSLSFNDGLGNALVGSVTTDGVLGPVAVTDITAWSFTASGSPSFSIPGFFPAQPIDCSDSGCGLFADATYLKFNFSGSVTFCASDLEGCSGSFRARVTFAPDLPTAQIEAFLGADCAGENFCVEQAFFAPGPGNIIGTSITSVPEPGTLTLVAASLAAVFGVARKRARGHQFTGV